LTDAATIAARLIALADAAPLYAPPALPSVPPLTETDSGMAERVAATHADDLRFDHRIGRWLIYQGHSWRGDPSGDVDRLVLTTIRNCYSTIGGLEEEAAKRRFKFLVKCESADRRAAVARLTRVTLPVADAGDGWDLKPDILGVRNGVISLPDGTLRPGRPNDRITLALDLDYDADAAAPRWEQFIREILPDPDLAAFIKRAIGYSLTGQMKEQCFFMCHGKGSNGKSVFLDTLAHLLGPLYAATPFSTFLAQKYGAAGPTNDLAALVARRAVSASEAGEGSYLNEDRLKAITGGERIRVRFLFREFFDFYPTCKIWLAVNHRPRVADDTLSFWRTFEGDAVDPDLATKLVDELPGIFAWSVQGAVEWYAGGLQPPASVLAVTAAYKREQDPLGEFLSAACDLGPEHHAGAKELGAAYGKWADDAGLRGHDRMTVTRLGRILGDRFESVHTRHGKVYDGLRVRPEREPGEDV